MLAIKSLFVFNTGGAGMYLGLLNLIAINTTARERPAYMGGTGVVWGTGTILSPVIGGAFADSSTKWRWVGVSSSYCPYFQC